MTQKRADAWFRLITLHAAAILGTVCVAMMAAAAPAAAGATLKLSPGQQRGAVHSGRLASRVVPPGHTIASAQLLPLGTAESGGGGPIDFWRVKLVGGDRVKFAVRYPASNFYEFELYAPGTTDASFPNAQPVDTGQTNPNVGTADVTLQAPYTGNFVFAVCENTSPCTLVDNGDGTSPMNPYTFTPTFLGEKTTTSLTLSKTSIIEGSEKKLKLSVTVKPQTSGRPTGTVTIRAGTKTVCSLQLSSQGTGTC